MWNAFRVLASRIRAVFSARRLDDDFTQELALHLAMLTEENIRRGMSPEEAARAARLRLGGPVQLRETHRDLRAFPFLESLLQDVRYAARQLRRSPGFAAVAILTLALGIGANTAIFSVVDAVLLRSLPYPDARHLVVLNEALPLSGGLNVSLPDFLDWQAQNHVFARMAAYSPNSVTLTGAGEPVLLRAAFVSWSFFPLLGAKPFLGRTFSEAEDKPSAPWVGVVVSYSLWRDKLDGNPKIIGKQIALDGDTATVIGVLQPDFRYPGLQADVYNQMGPMARIPGFADRSNHPGIQVLARLKPGVSLAAARSDMDVIMGRLGAQYPKSNRGERANITPLYTLFLGNIQPVLFMLFGAAGFVLLLACVNVANLFLARATSRHQELALRAAMGAGRARLIRQLLTESVLLSFLGGAAGLFLAFGAMKPLLHLAPAWIPNIAAARLNSSVLVFTIVAAALTGILFGLAPSLQTTRSDLDRSLKSKRGLAPNSAGHRLRSGLLVAQVAAAVILVIGSGLLIRSLSAALAVNPGFNPDHLLALDVVLAGTKNNTALDFYNEALRRIRHLPGVQSAAAVMQPPLAGLHWTSPYMVEGRPAPPPSERPWTAINMITPDYFRTMQARLLAGRFFTDADNEKAPPVIIINQSFATRLWPNESALGKRINAQEEWRQVVGVVADLKQFGLTSQNWPETFLPFEQMPVGFVTVVVRTSVSPSKLAHAAADAIQSLDKNQPVTHIVPMTQRVATSVESQKFSASLLGLFGMLALLLAAIGIYGVMAYTVTQRTHEVGIRVALGARRADVLKLIVGSGLRLALAGIVIGIVASFALTRLISNQLFGVTPTDPVTFCAVATLFLVIALLACYIPARRAMRVDPMVALRHE